MCYLVALIICCHIEGTWSEPIEESTGIGVQRFKIAHIYYTKPTPTHTLNIFLSWNPAIG